MLWFNDSNDKSVAYVVHPAKNVRYMAVIPEKVVSCFVDADESGRLCVVHIGGYVLEYVTDIGEGPAMSLTPAKVVEYVFDNGKRVGYVIDAGEYYRLRR